MSNSSPIDFKVLAAEAIATFFLVLVGTGSIILDEEGIFPFGNVGIALCFGGIVCLMILVFGKISGAHMNPIVSLFFYLEKGLSRKVLVGYVVFQTLGAFLASLFLLWTFPINEYLGSTLPKRELYLVFLTEVMLSYLLIFVISALHRSSKRIKSFAAFLIGGIIFLEAFTCGQISGASMNPIRSIAPAGVSGHIEDVWIYILATNCGMLLFWFQKRIKSS